MAVYRKGDVVLVPVGFTNQSGAKLRPAVVVSTDAYNQQCPDVLIAPVTSNLSAVHHPGDHAIVDWLQAGLKLPSLAQAKIATVDSSIIVQTLGRLSTEDQRRLDEGLVEALNLPSQSLGERIKAIIVMMKTLGWDIPTELAEFEAAARVAEATGSPPRKPTAGTE